MAHVAQAWGPPKFRSGPEHALGTAGSRFGSQTAALFMSGGEAMQVTVVKAESAHPLFASKLLGLQAFVRTASF